MLLRCIALALGLLLASPAPAQQVTPSFGLDSSGAARQLYVRDSTLPGFVPMGTLNTASHTFVASSSAEAFGAVAGPSGNDVSNTTAINSALTAAAAAGQCVTGSSKSYRVNGSVLLTGAACLEDITLVQTITSPWSRTITNACGASCPGPFTLRRVKVDYTAQPTTSGSINDHAGIWLADTVNLRLEDVEVTGNGAGTGLFLLRATGARISSPWVHDIEWSSATDPGTEMLQGMRCSGCTDVAIVNPRIDGLWGTIPWAASTSLAGSQGKAWRVNGGNTYRAQTNGTTGTSAPTCTVGSCSDGGVTWDWMGAYPAVKRSYQADGLDFSTANHVSVYGGYISHVWEGSDASGGGVNNDLWFYGTVYQDIDGWGQKWAHSPQNSGSIGCRVTRAGLGAFTIVGGTGADASSPQHMRIVNAMAIDTGSNGNWGTKVGFQNSGGSVTPFEDVQFINPTAIDTQAVPTMAWGFINQTTGPDPDAMILVNPTVVGAFVADYVGVTSYIQATSAGLNVAGQVQIVNTAAGASAVALSLANANDSAGTETVIDLAPNTHGIGGRSAQIAAVAVSGNVDARLVFRTAFGGVPAQAMAIGPVGGSSTRGGVTVGTSALADPGIGNVRVGGGVQVAVTTVAALAGGCTAATEGNMRAVSDANSTTYNAVAAGGGTNHMPVYCNGTAWTLH